MSIRLGCCGGRRVVLIKMQNFWDVYGRLCHPSSLLAPYHILAVVCLTELTVRHAAPSPRIDVPCVSLSDRARLVSVIALTKLEVYHAVLAVVGRALQERDHVCTTGGCLQQLFNVGVGHVVIIVDERDVLPTSHVEQCLPLRANAALAVVTQDQMLDSMIPDLLLDARLQRFELLLASRYRRGQY